MRRLITFIVRLWVDVRAAPPAWEGQVECVADGAREHIRAQDDLLAFIEAHIAVATDQPPTGDRESPTLA